MPERIVFTNGTTFECPAQAAPPVGRHPAGREWRRITVTAAYAEVKDAFLDDAVYRREWDSIRIIEDGVETTETFTEDLSDYSIAGDIVDTRDGNITVYMGRKTESELQQETIDALLLELLGV